MADPVLCLQSLYATNSCALESTHQKDMFEDLRRTVHLAQDDDHLFVDEALELPQVARHVHLQLCSDLWNTRTGEARG